GPPAWCRRTRVFPTRVRAADVLRALRKARQGSRPETSSGGQIPENPAVFGLDTLRYGRYIRRTFAAGGEFPRRHGGTNASIQETQTLLLTALVRSFGCMTAPLRVAVLCRCNSAVPPGTGRRGFVLRGCRRRETRRSVPNGRV